jgi:hypothetical protein
VEEHDILASESWHGSEEEEEEEEEEKKVWPYRE